MAKYSYQQFIDYAKEAGMLDQFSDADMKLASENPDVGMSLLKYKTDYKNAETDEARSLANAGANNIRSSYGGYTGGGDGGSFALTGLSPRDFVSGSAPSYVSRYDDRINELLDAVTNRSEFNYNPDTDPLYSASKKMYLREGKRATADALAEAAAMTGGMPSSYAVTAATQAGDYYASKFNDKLQSLYELAYNKYLQDYQMKLSDLDAVRAVEQDDYNKYLTELSQFNTDRAFEYGQFADEISNQAAARAEALQKAQLAAQYGDYSYLGKEGITPDFSSAQEQAQYERELELAKLAANLGDVSYLNKLTGMNIQPTSGGSSSDGTLKAGSSQYNAELNAAKVLDARDGGTKHVDAVYRKYGLLTDNTVQTGNGNNNTVEPVRTVSPSLNAKDYRGMGEKIEDEVPTDQREIDKLPVLNKNDANGIYVTGIGYMSWTDFGRAQSNGTVREVISPTGIKYVKA